MIDYTKVNNLPVSVEKMLSHERLTFPLSNVATTGELLNRAQVAHYGKMEIVVKGRYIKLKGSYHKHDQGGTNYKDFTFPDVQRIIKELENTFHFDPKDAHFNFIEIGVNIEVLTDPSRLIKNFLLYKNKEFEPVPVTGTGYGRQCRLQQCTIKVYDKSLQNRLPYHLLRFEVKITRMEFLKVYGINNLTMEDLLRTDVYSLLLKMLLDILSRILLFNPDINIDSIQNPKDRELVLLGRFPEYWKELSRQRKSEQIKRFTELTGSNNLKTELAEKISEKWNLLMTPDKLTIFQGEQDHNSSDRLTTFQPISKLTVPDELTTLKKNTAILVNEKSGQINTTINGYYICPITGLDISMQSNRSKFLTAKGVEFYYNNHPEIFESRLYNLLTDRMKLEKLQKKFEEIAHAVRRKQYNPQYHHQQRVIRMRNENGGWHLFAM